MEVGIKLLSKSSIIPTKQTAGSSGYDLYAYISKPMVIKGRRTIQIPTGICIDIPRGYEAQVRSRSGLARDYGLVVLNSPGTIDSDYRGEIIVLLHNTSRRRRRIEVGSRIAQLVFAPIETPILVVQKELQDTERSSGGFGSTGYEGK